MHLDGKRKEGGGARMRKEKRDNGYTTSSVARSHHRNKPYFSLFITTSYRMQVLPT